MNKTAKFTDINARPKCKYGRCARKKIDTLIQLRISNFTKYRIYAAKQKVSENLRRKLQTLQSIKVAQSEKDNKVKSSSIIK